MLKRIWNHIIKVQEIRAAEYALRNLTDKQLKDIGTTRGEIKQKVRS